VLRCIVWHFHYQYSEYFEVTHSQMCLVMFVYLWIIVMIVMIMCL